MWVVEGDVVGVGGGGRGWRVTWWVWVIEGDVPAPARKGGCAAGSGRPGAAFTGRKDFFCLMHPADHTTLT